MKPHKKKKSRFNVLLRIVLFVVIVLAPLYIFNIFYPQPFDFLIFIGGIWLAFVCLYIFFLWLYRLFDKTPEKYSDLESHLPLIIDEAYAICHENGLIEYATPFFYTLLEHNSTAKQNIYSILSGNEELHKTLYKLQEDVKNGHTRSARIVLNIGSKKVESYFDITLKPYDSHLQQQRFILFKLLPVHADNKLMVEDISALQETVNQLDLSPIGIFSCNYDGQITYANVTFIQMIEFDTHVLTDKLPNIRDIFSLNAVEQIIAHNKNVNTLDNLTIHASCITGETKKELILVKHNRSDGTNLSYNLIALDPQWFQSLSHSPQSKPLYYERSPFGIGYINSKGKILEANTKFCDFFENHNLVSSDFFYLLDEEETKQFHTILHSIQHDKELSYPLTLNFLQKTKKSAQFQFIRDPSFQKEHNTSDIRILIFLIDTTEKYILEESHAQSQKMQAIGQLAGGIAHDFNNVLTGIIGASDILLTSMSPSSKQFDEVIQIKNNANRAANLVQHLMAFSRKQKLKPITLSLAEVISADFKNLIQKLITSTIKLHTQINRDLWFIKADENQLEQVIINLAVNARDAMPDGGTLHIRAYNVSEKEIAQLEKHIEPIQEYVCLEIEDDGTGIPHELIDNIFEPFFTTKETGKGTGMGLSTVYGIIKQSEGHIFVESQKEKGTRFSIYLPHHHAEMTYHQMQEKARQQKRLNKSSTAPIEVSDYTGSRERILLVEDEDSVRSFATRALTQQGYIVSDASGGLEALELIDKGSQFDLIISDVLMPGMDGPTLIQEIRKRKGITPTIFISGYADDAFKNNLDEDSFVFLTKPFGIKQLVEAVKNTLGQRI